MTGKFDSRDADQLSAVISKARLQSDLANHLLNAVVEYAQEHPEVTTDDLLQVLKLLRRQIRTIYADLWMYGDAAAGFSSMPPMFSMNEEDEEVEADHPPEL